MPKLRFILPLLALLCTAPPARAGFEEGFAAYNHKDWERTILELRPLAETGDDRAMLLIANMYYYGYGLPVNYREALSLYRRAAAEKNNTEAMLAAAAMYTSGFGVESNLVTAAQWYLRAARLGDQAGAFFYATILYRGNRSITDDIAPDFYNSYKWFRICGRYVQGNPRYREMALLLAAAIVKKKLSAEEAARADKEAAEWKPEEPAALGPIPPEPLTTAEELQWRGQEEK